MQIVLATSNPGKVREIAEVLAGLDVVLIPRADIPGAPAVEETGSTYLENARLKAEALVEATGLAALAEDSGIEVDALQGRPGIHSARFSGEGATDESNNRLLVGSLEGVHPQQRGARYRAVAVLKLPDGREFVTEGLCEGSIATEARGTGGFGYDPYFIPEGHPRHMAELSPAEKNIISHRGKALRKMAKHIDALTRQGPG